MLFLMHLSRLEMAGLMEGFLNAWLIFLLGRDFPEETFPPLRPFCIFSPLSLFLFSFQMSLRVLF